MPYKINGDWKHMKFDSEYESVMSGSDRVDEGFLGDILKMLMQALVTVIRGVFGPGGEKLGENIGKEVQMNSRVETYNRLADNFNRAIGKIEHDRSYSSSQKPFLNVYVKLDRLDSRTPITYFKPGDGRKPVSERTPVEIPFRITGYGIRQAAAGKDAKDVSEVFDFQVKDRPPKEMSLGDIEDIVQEIFDMSVSKNRNLGIDLTVSTVNPSVNTVSVASIDFDREKYSSNAKVQKMTKKDEENIIPLFKKYFMKGGLRYVKIPSTDDIQFKGVPSSSREFGMKYHVHKQIKDLQGIVLMDAGKVPVTPEEYDEKVVKIINLRLKEWMNVINKKMEKDKMVYRMSEIALAEQPDRSKRIIVLQSWTRVRMTWEKVPVKT